MYLRPGCVHRHHVVPLLGGVKDSSGHDRGGVLRVPLLAKGDRDIFRIDRELIDQAGAEGIVGGMRGCRSQRLGSRRGSRGVVLVFEVAFDVRE